MLFVHIAEVGKVVLVVNKLLMLIKPGDCTPVLALSSVGYQSDTDTQHQEQCRAAALFCTLITCDLMEAFFGFSDALFA